MKCTEHSGCLVNFWCKTCKEKACQHCFLSKHESHVLTSFRKHLHQEATTQFSKVKENIQRITENTNTSIRLLQDTFDSLSLESAKVELKKEEFLQLLDDFKTYEQKWAGVEKFVENMDHEINLTLVELFLAESNDFRKVHEFVNGYQAALLVCHFSFRAELFYCCYDKPVPVHLKRDKCQVKISFCAPSAGRDKEVIVSVYIVNSTDGYTMSKLSGSVKLSHPNCNERCTVLKFEGTPLDPRSVKKNATVPTNNLRMWSRKGVFSFVCDCQLDVHLMKQ